MVDWATRAEKLEALLNVALARIVELEGKLCPLPITSN
jgi:hypothetical protein